MNFLSFFLICSIICNIYGWDYILSGSNWDGLCKNGKHQSPISIKTKNITKITNPVIAAYNIGNELKYNRYIFTYNFTNSKNNIGSIFFEGRLYLATEFHYHIKSEHTINKNRGSLELHIVHKDKERNILVVAIIFKKGKENEFLEELLFLDWNLDESGTINIEALNNLQKISVIGDTENVLIYNGSLTTPPCTEGVVWVVISSFRELSEKQYKLINDMKNTLMGHSRPYRLLQNNSNPVYRGILMREK